MNKVVHYKSGTHALLKILITQILNLLSRSFSYVAFTTLELTLQGIVKP